ncbi:MAG: hypothetical protein LBQ73_05385 [Tannerellaceae bacterium]|jgi:hypothetical protein|nr:hypothetical protein [Tannerellaceae bacterium]
MKKLVSSFLFLAVMCSCSNEKMPYNHSMHPLSQIKFVKDKIKKQQEPIYSAYQQLLYYADSIQNVSANALEDFSVPGYYVDPDSPFCLVISYINARFTKISGYVIPLRLFACKLRFIPGVAGNVRQFVLIAK